MKLLLFMLLNISAAEPQTHTAAHIGTSYTLQTALYGVNSRIFGLSNRNAHTLAFIQTLSIGYAYKINQKASQTDINRAMIQNLTGASLGVGLSLVFDF